MSAIQPQPTPQDELIFFDAQGNPIVFQPAAPDPAPAPTARLVVDGATGGLVVRARESTERDGKREWTTTEYPLLVLGERPVRDRTGKQILVETKEPLTSTVLYPLAWIGTHGESRIMFPKPYVPDSQPLCKSTDGSVADTAYAGTLTHQNAQGVNTVCAACPFGEWTTEGGKYQRDCNVQYALLTAMRHEDAWAVVEVVLKGVATKTGRALFKELNNILAQVQDRALDMPAYLFPFRIATRTVQELTGRAGMVGYQIAFIGFEPQTLAENPLSAEDRAWLAAAKTQCEHTLAKRLEFAKKERDAL